MEKLIDFKGRYLIAVIFLLAIFSISNSCNKDSTYDTGVNPKVPGPGTNEVWIQGSAFNPETITVTAGTTITWTNKDGIIHTVTGNTGLFDSGNIGNSGTYSLKFTSAGTFQYYCRVHPAMTGKVAVN